MSTTLIQTPVVRAEMAATKPAPPAAPIPPTATAIDVVGVGTADTHAAAVFKSFDHAYASAYGADKGKFWTDRYAPGLAPYANLVNARNARVVALAGRGEAVLDVGSGYGDLIYLLRGQFQKLRGIDPSAQVVKLAEYNLRTRGVTEDYEFRQGVAEKLPFEDEGFDVVLMLDAYEHVETGFRGRALEEARRVLKRGGSLILVTPSRGILRFWTVLDNILMLPRQWKAWRKKKTPIQLWEFTRKDYCEVFESRRSVSRALRKAGLKLERFERVSFYPAPERGGFLGPALEASDPKSRFVRWMFAFVRMMERMRFLNQKMLFKAVRVD